jgi:hypothetical protein
MVGRFTICGRGGVRNLVRAGVLEGSAMKISGHKTASVFRRYKIISGTDLYEAARKLDVYLRLQEKEIAERESESRVQSQAKFDDSLMKENVFQ